MGKSKRAQQNIEDDCHELRHLHCVLRGWDNQSDKWKPDAALQESARPDRAISLPLLVCAALETTPTWALKEGTEFFT